jgi:hypothetical protein
MKKFIALISLSNIFAVLSEQEFENILKDFENIKKTHQYLSSTSAFLEGDANQFQSYFQSVENYLPYLRTIRGQPEEDKTVNIIISYLNLAKNEAMRLQPVYGGYFLN